MRRSVAVTFRIHRFEVFASLCLLMAVGVGLVILPGRLEDVGAGECLAGAQATGCRDLIDEFVAIRSNEASWLLGIGAGLFPVLIGLLLGSQIVARELEHRTALIAWGVSGDRSRWLRQRMLPMLALAIGGLAILGLLETRLLATAYPGSRLPRLDELGSQGPTYVARGLLAFGVALLIGALLGRGLPTFLISGSIVLILVIFGAPFLYLSIARAGAVWQATDQPSGIDTMLFEFSERYRDSSGRRLSQTEIDVIMAEPDGETRLVTEFQREVLGYPYGSFWVIEAAETSAGVIVGATAIVLTFPAVRRRRPL